MRVMSAITVCFIVITLFSIVLCKKYLETDLDVDNFNAKNHLPWKAKVYPDVQRTYLPAKNPSSTNSVPEHIKQHLIDAEVCSCNNYGVLHLNVIISDCSSSG